MRHLNDEHSAYFSENDRVLVALSGGADSVCLLHLLKNSPLHLDVYACHVNHNLRGDESLRDLDFVKALCQDMDIKLFVKEADISTLASERKLSVEECARAVRYEFFEECAVKLDAKIATAHTLSDNCETILLNMTRGSGGKGLCGIPKIRGNIVRPILSFTREDVISYCNEHGLEFVTDSTNAMTIYTRNKIRHEIIPVLKEINPSFELNINNFVNIMHSEQDFILGEAKKLYLRAKTRDGIDITVLRDAHPTLKSRIAMMFLEEHNLSVNSVNIGAITDIFDAKAHKFNIKGSLFICRVGDCVRVMERQVPTEFFEIPLIDGDFESKMGILYKISTVKIKINQKFYISTKNVYEFFIDCDKICGDSIIRQRLPADFIKLEGKNHTKSLKKLFNEAKIEADTRKKLFVIADEKGVIALENFGVAQRVSCDENTRRYIHIVIKDKKNII